MAVSVASGTDALGRFRVQTPGPVLLYGAEDAPVALRDRIETIARARGLALDDLDLGLIVVDSLRLDAPRDRARLRATLQVRSPRIVILDPLVRLHRFYEFSAGVMSALLGELRALQREYHVAIALVHHVRKYASPRGQEGQSLRSSGDLHAWGDSLYNLYLRRREGQIVLTVEHRSAPSPPPCTLELANEPDLHLRIVEGGPAPNDLAVDAAEKIISLLTAGPMSREALRAALHARNATVGDALVRLRAEGRVVRADGGFRLGQVVPVPTPRDERERNGAL